MKHYRQNNSTCRFEVKRIIKQDATGHIERGTFIYHDNQSVTAIKRVYSSAKWWARPIARLLAHNEKKSLLRLQTIAEQTNALIPRLLHTAKGYIIRSFVVAKPLCKKPPTSPLYYTRAKALLRNMRRAGICSNDLAKESNWLVTEDSRPVLIDFELSLRFKKNNKLLRLLCREDLRHLLKHKQKYCPQALTAKEKQILQQKSLPSKLWEKTIQKLYRWYTREVLGWQKRKSPIDRGTK